MNTCIQICSGQEWRSIKKITAVDQNDVSSDSLGEFFEHKIGNNNYIFFHSGPTKTRAAAACQHAIDKWKPSLIINIGTCGGVSLNLEILDIILADKTIQYDCLDFIDMTDEKYYPPTITNIDNSWVHLESISKTLKRGIIGTGDQDLTYEKALELREDNFLAVDWESGAISLVCSINKIKCLILRGVSDIPKSEDHSDREQQANDYKNNTLTVMKSLIGIISELDEQLSE
ncbi:MAG: 5'-methylthioadenosine/S-adenosylhomocysteine nucleosidase [Bacteriovoracaceae bacterium]|nr:5'-methylthioadenosine/S-adenosylhomocysteine nucleosidase [Bacteriovoracaceae bacterium]